MTQINITGDNINISVDGQQIYGSGSGSNPPSQGGIPAVTSKPNPVLDLGTGATNNPGVPAGPNEVIGASFTIDNPGAQSKTLKAFGDPGNFPMASWAIFDSGGNVVFSATNVPSNLQALVEPSMLAQLAAGTYVFAVRQGLQLPKLAFYFQN